jgi:hypothetical protein
VPPFSFAHALSVTIAHNQQGRDAAHNVEGDPGVQRSFGLKDLSHVPPYPRQASMGIVHLDCAGRNGSLAVSCAGSLGMTGHGALGPTTKSRR